MSTRLLNRSRRPLTVLAVASALAALSVFATDTPPPPIYGWGQWVNPVVTSLCDKDSSGSSSLGGGSVVCVEFIDDLEFSPFTGAVCCLERSVAALGYFYSCENPLRMPPKEGDGDLPLQETRPW